MALLYIGSAVAATNTVNLPAGHKAGDLVVVLAVRSGNTTAPTLPTGLTSLQAGSGTLISARVGYKLAVSSADTSGVWTNATTTLCAVYRNQATNKTPVRAGNMAFLNTTIVNYGQIAGGGALQAPANSWVAAMGYVEGTTSTIEVPPTGLTNRFDDVGASVETVVHDSAGPIGQWQTTSSDLATTAKSIGVALEILTEQMSLQNYMSIDVGSGMSAGERLR